MGETRSHGDHLIRPLRDKDRGWVAEFIVSHWGAEIVVAHGTVYRPHTLQGFLAEVGTRKVGLLTYHIAGGECEIVTLNSTRLNRGVGTALLEAGEEAARRAGCRRLWLITTNDNLHALGFYQKRGFVLVAVHRNALEESRRLKPQIGHEGMNGIPLRDEIELERILQEPA